VLQAWGAWTAGGIMVTMTLLPRSRPLTADDLESMPEDGHRYELIDGTLIVTPAPARRHQRAVGELYLLLRQTCPASLEVLLAPFDVKLAEDTVLQPDLLVTRRSDTTERNLPAAPLLALEVLSPSTGHIDLSLKRARYEVARCPSYWVVDPEEPALLVWELRDGSYVEVARVAGEASFTASLPYDVTVSPARLVV
jgi:Uma2 family endonuclease